MSGLILPNKNKRLKLLPNGMPSPPEIWIGSCVVFIDPEGANHPALVTKVYPIEQGCKRPFIDVVFCIEVPDPNWEATTEHPDEDAPKVPTLVSAAYVAHHDDVMTYARIKGGDAEAHALMGTVPRYVQITNMDGI